MRKTIAMLVLIQLLISIQPAYSDNSKILIPDNATGDSYGNCLKIPTPCNRTMARAGNAVLGIVKIKTKSIMEQRSIKGENKWFTY